MEFYIPDTLATDFDDYLQSPLCSDVEKIRDWSANPQVLELIRAEITNINFKSKISNSDNAAQCRVSKSTDFQKGDILYDSKNNIYYLVTWRIFNEVNCKSTQLQICNMNIELKRHVPETVDNNGMVVSPATDLIVVPQMKACFTRTGYYVFQSKYGEAGIMPNNKMIVSLQANLKTLGLKITDTFDFHSDVYQIVDIDYSELNPDGQSGMVMIYAEKKAGG